MERTTLPGAFCPYTKLISNANVRMLSVGNPLAILNNNEREDHFEYPGIHLASISQGLG